jgi:carbon monoxide dehydrogenase subunit G
MRYRLAENRIGEFISWEQDLAGTPFARSVLQAVEAIQAEPADGGTKVTLTIRRKLKGTAKMGSLLVARGQRKELDEALRRLERRFEN